MEYFTRKFNLNAGVEDLNLVYLVGGGGEFYRITNPIPDDFHLVYLFTAEHIKTAD